VYDADTRALILNDQKIADRSSRMDLRKNDDGCVDIYCGPKAPAGFEQNWIPTVPGKTGSPISASTASTTLICWRVVFRLSAVVRTESAMA
jgi:hypothetical protein